MSPVSPALRARARLQHPRVHAWAPSQPCMLGHEARPPRDEHMRPSTQELRPASQSRPQLPWALLTPAPQTPSTLNGVLNQEQVKKRKHCLCPPHVPPRLICHSLFNTSNISTSKQQLFLCHRNQIREEILSLGKRLKLLVSTFLVSQRRWRVTNGQPATSLRRRHRSHSTPLWSFVLTQLSTFSTLSTRLNAL